MNIRVTINPTKLNVYDFKHILSYRILSYILVNLNPETMTIELNPNYLIYKLVTNGKSYMESINELVRFDIIKKVKKHYFLYSVNKEFVVAVFSVPDL